MTAAAKRQTHQTPRVVQRDRLPHPTGGSWWAEQPRELFTACAISRFAKGDSKPRAVYETTESAISNRAPRREQLYVDPRELETGLPEIEGAAVESADTETE